MMRFLRLALAAVMLVFAGAAMAASPTYQTTLPGFAVQGVAPMAPAGTNDQYGNPQVTPPIITPSASTSGVTSQVVETHAGNFIGAKAVNLTATIGFLVVIDATVAPTNGATITPFDFAPLPASGSAAIDYDQGEQVQNGVVVLVTSAATPYTYQTSGISAAIQGRAH